MNSLARVGVLAGLGALASAGHAHIGYTNRDFGTLVNGSNKTIATQTVSSNYGWADASDLGLVFDSALALSRDASNDETTSGVGIDNLYLGDSHKARAFRLHLDGTLAVTVTATKRDAGSGGAGLLPGFSVYKGLAAISPFSGSQSSADYDFSNASQAWRTSWAQAHVGNAYAFGATQGNWDALGDWYSGGDGDPSDGTDLSYFQFVGHGSDGNKDGDASTTLTLGPGDYSIFVGGGDIGNKGSADAAKTYGLTLNVSAVPEPQAAVLMLLGLPVLALRRRGARG